MRKAAEVFALVWAGSQVRIIRSAEQYYCSLKLQQAATCCNKLQRFGKRSSQSRAECTAAEGCQ
jgi:hypothetical protein